MHNIVLITGAAGFLGRHVASFFSKDGYQVHGMGRGTFPEYEKWGLSTWHECDISMESLGAFAGRPEIIIHCAGGSSVGYSVEHPRQDFCLTVDTTSHLLEYIRLYSPETRLVYPSTAAVYGQVKSVPITEKAPLQPVSPYGVHKLMAESLCQMYAHRFGLAIATVRLFSIYGNGLRKQLLWDACNKFSNGEAVFFGTGEEMRDWLHVTDAANLLRKVALHACSDHLIINGGTGSGVKVSEILQCLAAALSFTGPVQFSMEHKDGDPDVLIADISKSKALKWEPLIHWREGVSAYAKWFQSCHQSE